MEVGRLLGSGCVVQARAGGDRSERLGRWN